MTEKVKEAEAAGYTFEAADASFELLLRRPLQGADHPATFPINSLTTDATPPRIPRHGSVRAEGDHSGGDP